MFFSVGACFPTTTCHHWPAHLELPNPYLFNSWSQAIWTCDWGVGFIADHWSPPNYRNIQQPEHCQFYQGILLKLYVVFILNSERNHDHYYEWSNTHDSNHCFTITYPHTIIMNQTKKLSSHPSSFIHGLNGQQEKLPLHLFFCNPIPINTVWAWSQQSLRPETGHCCRFSFWLVTWSLLFPCW